MASAAHVDSKGPKANFVTKRNSNWALQDIESVVSVSKIKCKHKAKSKKASVSRPRPLHFLGPALSLFYLLVITFVRQATT